GLDEVVAGAAGEDGLLDARQGDGAALGRGQAGVAEAEVDVRAEEDGVPVAGAAVEEDRHVEEAVRVVDRERIDLPVGPGDHDVAHLARVLVGGQGGVVADRELIVLDVQDQVVRAVGWQGREGQRAGQPAVLQRLEAWADRGWRGPASVHGKPPATGGSEPALRWAKNYQGTVDRSGRACAAFPSGE